MKRILSVLFIFPLVFASVSCDRRGTEIEFDTEYPLALAPDVSWAVVTDPYISYKESPHWDASNTGHCRRGEILRVLGNSLAPDGTEWYLFGDGWLPSSGISVYSNRYKAAGAAALYAGE